MVVKLFVTKIFTGSTVISVKGSYNTDQIRRGNLRGDGRVSRDQPRSTPEHP